MFPIGIDDDGNLQYENNREPYVIRTTDRTNFKKCRRLWRYTSKNGLNLEPARPNNNLLFGIAIHKGLEHYYNPEQWTVLSDRAKTDIAVAAFENELSARMKIEGKDTNGLDSERIHEYSDMRELGVGMLRNYGQWAPARDEKLRLVPLHVEYKFQVPVYMSGTDIPLIINGVTPVVYQVRADLIAKHEAQDDSIWIWDHKTAAGVTSDLAFLDNDTQLASYAWAWRVKTGTPCSGVMYNELAKSVPKEPRVLKKGDISQDKRQNTTYELYKAKIEELGLDAEPYSAMLEFLSEKPESRFRRTPIRLSERQLFIQGQHVVAEIEDMTDNPALYPNASKFNCNGCAFQAPCAVENEGDDPDLILYNSHLFRPRVEDEDVLNAAS